MTTMTKMITMKKNTTMTTDLRPDNFYCSQKFTWLSADFEKKLLYSCCSAQPESVDLTWVDQHPDQLFNTNNLLKEREQMLNNQVVESCHVACWLPESNNLPSRRTQMKTWRMTHTNTHVEHPEILNLILGKTCNLTCVYCCKQYSSAWTKDILNNGIYLEDPRFLLTTQDRLLSKTSQPELENSNSYKKMLQAVLHFRAVDKIIISGGEPFLFNNLPDLVNELSDAKSINITTGLGVDPKRLEKMIARINNKSNLQISVSIENCDNFYEFVRYNNAWSRFTTNMTLLQDNGLSISLMSTLSNLTVFGFIDFYQRFCDYPKFYSFVNDPDFLAVNVLDPTSKKIMIKMLESTKIEIKDKLINGMNKDCDEQQRQNFSSYLKQFASRRNLSLDLYPNSMLQWLDLI